MLNQLHDEIDKTEDIQEKAREVVSEVVGKYLRPILDEVSQETDDIEEAIAMAFALLTEIVEDELAGMTTEAFQAGVEFSKERIGK